ncbi:hypothetical protein GCM10022297_01050 [Lactobacillus hamsteri]|uniref:DUF2577 domain-containing protein n=1 Tax=Lactobacillus hamsteri DSM 5661 = JCM 6256 TaxID=1423754 RepID=A0A0R1YDH4_9LACO|nr:DUF2577 family protein [Lactobacillus hamsteri]KRM36995.1 hypothetical protein FC39_GL000447 [Lactobacillus hamsteri DSM 5661 = JCM 6256]
MAGEQILKLLKSRGGKPSDYADIVYGVVKSTDPLKVQIANDMVITEDFIELGRHIGKIKLQGKLKSKGSLSGFQFHGHSGSASFSKSDIDFPKKDFYLEINNELEKDDKVTLVRCDGGQRFYLFERTDKDGYGF